MSKTIEEIGGNAIIYTYPNGDYDIVCSSDQWYHPAGWEENTNRPREPTKPAPREAGKKSEGQDQIRSMRRARANLRRLALANEFRYFVTLTLDDRQVDRYDPKAIMRKVNRWLDNSVRRNGLNYILVPELHRDGAIHFHGFFAGSGLAVADSGTIRRPGDKKPRKPRSKKQREEWLAEGGQIVYNLPQWGLGFSTALELRGEYPQAVSYVCKYIGKQECQRPMGRWYYSGGSLAAPAKDYVCMNYREVVEDYGDECLEVCIPGSSLAIVHHRTTRKD